MKAVHDRLFIGTPGEVALMRHWKGQTHCIIKVCFNPLNSTAMEALGRSLVNSRIIGGGLWIEDPREPARKSDERNIVRGDN